ncbi:rhodanese domain-containing protein [Chondrocystis sp. NIES-4102]|nr:rhodanese domain-containing protein [Chondrocystis sp. NIES-4102]
MYYNYNISEIDVQQLASKIAQPEPELQLIDVREKMEAAIAQIEDFDLYPLSEFAQWSSEILTRLSPETETIVICHHGIRSAQFCQWLATQGFTNVHNVMGGIDAYARFIDPTLNRY